VDTPTRQAVAAGIPLRPVAGVDTPLPRAAVVTAHPLLPAVGEVGEVAAVRTAGGDRRCQVPGFRCQGTWHLREFTVLGFWHDPATQAGSGPLHVPLIRPWHKAVSRLAASPMARRMAQCGLNRALITGDPASGARHLAPDT